jgi:DNA helicase-2/ATP-dependent DNA helicase PcrA
MSTTTVKSPAAIAAQEAEEGILRCFEEGKSLLLEAGAGAGKTYSLIEALKHLIAAHAHKMRGSSQRIACITYTNAVTEVIERRIDKNPLVLSSTIHAFCWSLIKDFQPSLRKVIAGLPAWQEKLEEANGITGQKIEYDHGYRKIDSEVVSLHHDDVLAATVGLLPLRKFQRILSEKYPFILVDEYQDTDAEIMNAIKTHLLGGAKGPVVGLFGDHWQQIYDKTCGHVSHPALIEIGKKANFRSAVAIVNVLNKMRPALPQAVKDESFVGSAATYHTNSWSGQRRPGTGGGHWKGDLPAKVAHYFLQELIQKLKSNGWDFSADKTKVLMLTHNVLASEQGYSDLVRWPRLFGQVFRFDKWNLCRV